MHPAWLFILASIIAVFGILSAYKKLIRSIQEHIDLGHWSQDILQKVNTRYFINLAIVEAVPIVLLVIGLAQIEAYTISSSTRIVGVLVVLAVLVFGIVNIVVTTSDLTKGENVTDSHRASIKVLPLIGIGTISSIPIISIVGLFLLDLA
ncbi:hypothetical protein [Aquibacillus salsiterrae]|uniref:Uncharacterized protein n=1 Tax=Aquibacillus salsiterrae TaxID=2950439 RepID=A0A9X3WC48_9BACI|nr:hypothetical protein [Aquibacillus salsiterrae]MDC3417035.1 hypothetical protein [Aquibacillus salsiterrae]